MTGGVRYVDTQGNPVDPADLWRYEPVKEQMGALGGIASAAWSGVKDRTYGAALGALQRIGDVGLQTPLAGLPPEVKQRLGTTGNLLNPETRQDLQSYAAGLSERYRASQDQAREARNEGAGPVREFAQDAAEGVSGMLPYLLTPALRAAGTLGAMGYWGGTSAASHYGKAREAGAEPEKAELGALIEGAGSALETAPVWNVLNKTGMSPLGRGIRAALTEGATETAIGLPASLLADKASGLTDESWAGLAQQFGDQALYTFGLGATGGAVMAGADVFGARTRQKKRLREEVVFDKQKNEFVRSIESNRAPPPDPDLIAPKSTVIDAVPSKDFEVLNKVNSVFETSLAEPAPAPQTKPAPELEAQTKSDGAVQSKPEQTMPQVEALITDSGQKIETKFIPTPSDVEAVSAKKSPRVEAQKIPMAPDAALSRQPAEPSARVDLDQQVNEAIMSLDQKMGEIEPGKIVTKEKPDIEKYLEGQVLGEKVKWVGKMWRDPFTFKHELANMDPVHSRPRFNIIRQEVRVSNFTAKSLLDIGRTYFDTIGASRSRVDAYLAASRELSLKNVKSSETLESLQQMGLTNAEAAAVLSYRKMMAAATPIAEQVASGPDRQAISLDSVRSGRYAPFTRFGDYFVRAIDPATGTRVSMSTFATRAEANQEAKRLSKGSQKFFVETGEVKATGFERHFMPAEGVAGYERNIGRSTIDYITSLSDASATQRAKKAWGELPPIPENMPNTNKIWEDHFNYLHSDTYEAQGYRKFLGNYFLGGQLKSPVVNMSQWPALIVPELIEQVGLSKATKIINRSIPLTFKPVSVIAKSDPELAKAINIAQKTGDIDNPMTDFVTGKDRGTPSKDWSDYNMSLFSLSEMMMRRNAFISNYLVAREKGIKGSRARLNFALALNDKVAFIYDKTDRMRAATGPVGASAATFRTWSFNYINWLKNAGGKARVASLAALLGMAGVKGAASYGGYGVISSTLIKMGYDPDKYARKAINAGLSVWDLVYGGWKDEEPKKRGLYDTTTTAIYQGLPNIAGVSLGGSLAFSDLDPGYEKTPMGIVGNIALGVAANPLERMAKAKWLYKDLDQKGRAAEALMPESIRNLLVGARGTLDVEGSKFFTGDWRSPTGEIFIENPSKKATRAKTLSFQPTELNVGREIQNTLRVEAEKGAVPYLNYRMAVALTRSPRDIEKIITVAKENGLELSPTAIRDHVIKMSGELGTAINHLKRVPERNRPAWVRAFLETKGPSTAASNN